MDLIMEQFELDMDILQSKYERVDDIQDVIYKDISGYKDEEGNVHTVEILNTK